MRIILTGTDRLVEEGLRETARANVAPIDDSSGLFPSNCEWDPTRLSCLRRRHHRPRSRSIFRRSRFDGLPSSQMLGGGIVFRNSANFARASRLSSVSRYSVCATLAGPRMSLSSRTSTWNSPLSFFTRTMSPPRISRDGLIAAPFNSMRPSSHARDASARDLKNAPPTATCRSAPLHRKTDCFLRAYEPPTTSHQPRSLVYTFRT